MSKRKTVGKQLLSFAIQEQHGMTSTEANNVIDTLFACIEKQLLSGNAVSLLNIGTIKPQPKKAGQTRKAFGTEVVVRREVSLKISISPSFVEKFRLTKGAGAKALEDMAALSNSLKS